MGWNWEYEKEGYDLDGLRYLPDFWLPDIGHWFEVKGSDPNDREIIALSRLVYKSKHPAMLAIGAPQVDEHQIIYFTVPLAGRWHDNFSGYYATAYVGLNYGLYPARFKFGISDKGGLGIFPGGFKAAGSLICDKFELSIVRQALAAAIQARFEHGEQPITPTAPARLRPFARRPDWSPEIDPEPPVVPYDFE